MSPAAAGRRSRGLVLRRRTVVSRGPAAVGPRPTFILLIPTEHRPMSWLSPRAVRRRRPPSRRARPALLELESRVNPTNVLTYHNDVASNGVNNTETVLTRANVNPATFGK